MSGLISPIYNSIYTPTEEMLEARRAARPSKAEREMAVTLRQIARGLRKKKYAPLSAQARESHRLQQARWAKENPDAVRDAQKKWREKQDPELFRQYSRDAYEREKEKRKARCKAYYAANREAINAKRRAKRLSSIPAGL